MEDKVTLKDCYEARETTINALRASIYAQALKSEMDRYETYTGDYLKKLQAYEERAKELCGTSADSGTIHEIALENFKKQMQGTRQRFKIFEDLSKGLDPNSETFQKDKSLLGQDLAQTVTTLSNFEAYKKPLITTKASLHSLSNMRLAK